MKKQKVKAKNKHWRCFHCDTVFYSRKAAFLHFGPEELELQDVPACVDPLRYDEKARMAELREAQREILQCQEQLNEASDRIADLENDNNVLESELEQFQG